MEFLPALPDNWPVGELKGVRARGGVTLEFNWKDKTLGDVTVYADKPGNFKFRYRKAEIGIILTENEVCRLSYDGEQLTRSDQQGV